MNHPQNMDLPLQLPSKKLASLVLLGEEHSGRDEMNLAGHPFALLQAPGAGKSGTPIYYEWPRVLPEGRRVTASWHVKPGGLDGMPGPNEELLYLILLQITREAAEKSDTPSEWPQIVHFSRGDLLRRLGWHDGPRGVATLDAAFSRLTAVSIAAQWAFHDARTKAPMQKVGFHILSNFAITPEPMGRKRADALPLSWFAWDSVLHGSLLAGNVRSLALDFTLSLALPSARRLFRLLDMLRLSTKTPRREVAMGALKLRDRLGMTPYKFPSKIREKVMAGALELQAAGYLGEVSWEPDREGDLMAVFRFGSGQIAQVVAPAPKGPQNALKRAKTGDVNEEPHESKQDWAKRMADAFAEMPEEARTRLLEVARADVAPIFWDRLEVPDSPMSLTLWELVEREISA